MRLAEVLCTKNNQIASTVDQGTFLDILRRERHYALAALESTQEFEPILILTEPVHKIKHITEEGMLLASPCVYWLYINDPHSVRPLGTSGGGRPFLRQYRPSCTVQVKTRRGKWCTTRVVAHLYTARDAEVFYFLDNKDRRIMWDLTSLFPKTLLSRAPPQQQQPIQLSDVVACMRDDRAANADDNSDEEYAALMEELRQIPDDYFSNFTDGSKF